MLGPLRWGNRLSGSFSSLDFNLMSFPGSSPAAQSHLSLPGLWQGRSPHLLAVFTRERILYLQPADLVQWLKVVSRSDFHELPRLRAGTE